MGRINSKFQVPSSKEAPISIQNILIRLVVNSRFVSMRPEIGLRQLNAMKKTLLTIGSVAALLMAGCVVMSVYPFYTTKDVAFDPVLIGAWSEPGNTNADREIWTFEKLGDQAYKLTVREKNETNEFDVLRFKLKDHVFLDCFSRNRAAYTTPSHLLLRVYSMEPQLEMRPLDYEWLGKLLEKNPRELRHVIVPKAGEPNNDELLVLTADTSDLQKFVLKHIGNTNAWGDVIMKARE